MHVRMWAAATTALVISLGSLGGVQAVRSQSMSQTAIQAVESQTCKHLSAAYVASLLIPIPLPPPGASCVPAVALLVCCPQHVLEKVKTLVAKGAKLLDSNATMTDEEAQEAKQVEITNFYADLVSEHASRNPETVTQIIKSDLKSMLAGIFGTEPDLTKVALRNQLRHVIEVQYPWVLYPRITAAYNDDRLDAKESQHFTNLMLTMKRDYPWLPELPADLAWSGELQQDLEEISHLELDESSILEDLSQWTERKEHGRMCYILGHQAGRAVMAMQQLMSRPSDLQLEDLKMRLLVVESASRQKDDEYVAD